MVKALGFWILLFAFLLLSLPPLEMSNSISPPTRIHHLPYEQNDPGLDIADQEDERAVESYGWHAGHGHGRRGACGGKRSVFVDGNNALVIDIVEEEIAGQSHPLEVRSTKDERVCHAERFKRARQLKR